MKARATATALFFIAACFIATPAQKGGIPSPTPANKPYVRPDAETPPKALASRHVWPVCDRRRCIFGGSVDLDNKPPEWGKSWSGFGKRFASELGKGVIKGTMAYGLEEAFKLDSHYYRSQKRDPGSRLKYAITSAFTARTPTGRRVLGFPRLTGSYGSAIIATEAWYPSRLGMRDGLRAGTYSVGADILSNIFTEFFHR